MKKLLCILLLLFCIIGINSQTILTLGRVKVDGLNIARSGENLLVSMNIDVAGIDMPSSREVSFAPVLRAENNELFLSPVVLAGRNRYISIYAMMLLQVWVFHCFVPVMTG